MLELTYDAVHLFALQAAEKQYPKTQFIMGLNGKTAVFDSFLQFSH